MAESSSKQLKNESILSNNIWIDFVNIAFYCCVSAMFHINETMLHFLDFYAYVPLLLSPLPNMMTILARSFPLPRLKCLLCDFEALS
jgi:hypothetical protein